MAKKKTKKKAGAKAGGAKSAGKATGKLGAVSFEELQAEMARRSKLVGRLERKRNRLQAELSEIDAELASFGALSATGGIRRRPRNEMNLVDTLQKVLKNKTMSVTDAAQAARDAGYMTTAANFRTIVNQALIRETKTFKKVSRGQYTAK
ncbi:MAG: hypothetical protein ACSHX5_08655 [Phycisphaerales bacterium]